MVSYESVLSKLPETSVISSHSIAGKQLTTALAETEDEYQVKFISNLDHLVLHWGVGVSRPRDWKCPQDVPGVHVPANTSKFDEKASQSKFVEIHPAFSSLEIKIGKASAVQLNFVIKRDNAWFNNNNQNYSITLKQPDTAVGGSSLSQDLANEIVRVETEYNSWTLMHRFKLCNDWLQRVGQDIDALAYIYIWMRYSALRKLTWQKNFNTRPSELAASNQNLSFTIVNLLKSASQKGLVNPFILLKETLGCMGKGGNNGQRIRDQILEIMHRNGIKEHQNYYEQWHQKLHNNTTPDDIGICEATIEFNKTNNLQRFYEVLNQHGITRERLRSFERPITMDPYYAPHIVNDLYSYLDLLKAVHGSVDLTQSVNSCRFLPGDLQRGLDDLLGSLNHWDKISQMEKTVNVRKHLFSVQNKDDLGKYRECLYLDLNLESYTRKLCEEILHLDIKLPHLVRELRLLIQSVQLTAQYEELNISASDFFTFFDMFSAEIERNKEHALIIKAASDRLNRVLGHFVDQFTSVVGEKAIFLGTGFGAEKQFVDLFPEESIRGSLLFTVSMVLKKIDKILRKFCNFQNWQIISPKQSVSGKLVKVDSLSSVAYEKYPEATILLCERVTGEEEIPDNAVCVISLTELDALAHVSVRARNNKVLLAILFDNSELASLMSHVGSLIKITSSSSGLSFSRISALEEEEKHAEEHEIKPPLPLSKIIIQADEFQEGRTGAKGNNCNILKVSLPKHIGVPNSVALPFGTFEYVLALPVNQELSQNYQLSFERLTQSTNSKDIQKTLVVLKEATMQVQLTNDDKELIESVLQSIGCSSSKWSVAWKAIKSVWASKFNERVYLSTLKSKISLNDVFMSVLCQEVISGQYAYVLHTRNPFTNNAEELYAELVLGLGETLVGAYEGRSLSFVANKKTGSYEITSFFSKSVGLRGDGFIFRSDSNSEDLPGFAGAGLFDSFVMDPAKEETLRYKDERLILDRSFRESVVRMLVEVGNVVEEAFGGVAQDIEGVISGGKAFVVQSRPQV